jgi:hypothetical protein
MMLMISFYSPPWFETPQHASTNRYRVSRFRTWLRVMALRNYVRVPVLMPVSSDYILLGPVQRLMRLRMAYLAT